MMRWTPSFRPQTGKAKVWNARLSRGRSPRKNVHARPAPSPVANPSPRASAPHPEFGVRTLKVSFPPLQDEGVILVLSNKSFELLDVPFGHLPRDFHWRTTCLKSGVQTSHRGTWSTARFSGSIAAGAFQTRALAVSSSRGFSPRRWRMFPVSRPGGDGPNGSPERGTCPTAFVG